MKTKHRSIPTGVLPENEDDSDVRLIPVYSCTTEELAKLLKTNSNNLRKNFAGIRDKLGPRTGKWSIRQVAMIVEHWGTAPPEETDKVA